MNKVKLIRDELVSYKGTLGYIGSLIIDDKKWYTMENYAKRIKDGDYLLTFRNYGGMYQEYNNSNGIYQRVAEVQNGGGMIEAIVPNRTAILFHIGNFPQDSEGCILLGEGRESNYIKNSVDAYIQFYNTVSYMMKMKDTILSIEEL
ncbi:MAG: DUF5675 family protein [Bacteroidota bacterium]